MAEIVELVKFSPLPLLLVVLIFGFLPGFMLRLIVKVYPPDHPRRRELVAELYTIKRIERPFFVAEQLETALFEGLPARKLATRKQRELLNDLFDLPRLFLQDRTYYMPDDKYVIEIRGYEYRHFKLTRRRVFFEADFYQRRAFLIEKVPVGTYRRRMGMQKALGRTFFFDHQPIGDRDPVGEAIKETYGEHLRRQARARKRVVRLAPWLAAVIWPERSP
jgi:hypothetical protein